MGASLCSAMGWHATVCLVVSFSLAGCAASSNPERRACAHPDLDLRLPYSQGERYEVMQGNHGAYSHQGERRYAWDFRMPEGTLVIAAANGVVVRVADRFAGASADPEWLHRSNEVVIEHAGGRRSVYRHLRQHGVLVGRGERVVRGQPIAFSGNTGWSKEPHLHFEIADAHDRTLPVCFSDVAGGVPRYKGVYRSTNRIAGPVWNAAR